MLKTVFKAVAFYCFELCTNAFINHYCHVYKGMQKGKKSCNSARDYPAFLGNVWQTVM